MRVLLTASLLAFLLAAGGGLAAAHALTVPLALVVHAAPEPPSVVAAAEDPSPASLRAEVKAAIAPDAVDVVIGDSVEFPPDTMMFIESGCWGCDGPPAALYRVYRAGDGPLIFDKVFEADRAAYPKGYVMRYEIDDEARELRAFVCTYKYCGGLGYPESDSEVTLFRSWDYGSTWHRDVDFPGRFYPLGIAGGRLLTAVFSEDPSARPVYRLGDEVLPNPTLGPAYALAIDGQLFWTTEDVLFDQEGNPVDIPMVQTRITGLRIEDGVPVLALWSAGLASDSRFYLTAALAGGYVTYRLPTYLGSFEALDETLVVVSLEYPPERIVPRPSLLDLQTTTLRPIVGLDDRRFGRDLVRAVVRGPFWRVAAPPGACLPVQTLPRRQSQTLTCLVDGSVVRQLGQRRRFRGEDWVTVTLPDGRGGWALSSQLR